ncbi:MAG TPA: hypothetical protein VFB52_06625, partial [Solirubrobacterales bacterium]|nr:hypothetical protein [Solirubrobacterales bacterium]
DHNYIVQRSPVLADRLGARMQNGIENVAAEIARVLNGDQASDEKGRDPAAEGEPGALLSIPSSLAAQEELARQRPDWWEYRLFAGVLVEGLLRLEGKWQDHQLRLPGPERRYVDPNHPTQFFSQELSWVRRQLVVERIFGSEVLNQAFGEPGEPGDPERISHVVRRLIQMYEGLMDWAAGLRNANVPDQFEELVELYAQMVDLPLVQIRDFVQHAADQIAQLSILAQDGTEEEPVIITLDLTLSADEALMSEVDSALHRLSH